MKVTPAGCDIFIGSKKRKIIFRKLKDRTEVLENNYEPREKKIVAVSDRGVSVHSLLYEGANLIVTHRAASWFECRNAKGEKK